MTYALIVDDSESELEGRKRLLDGLDLGLDQILTAIDGQEALEVYQNNSGCRLVVSDYDMPNLNGEDLARALRQEREYQGPMLIISGTNDAARRTRLAELDVDVLNKSPNPIPLINYVKKVIT
tara:strand:- start:74 stop:442 length:369 start_codon:yes stop_codon:yes gene_type:complete